MSNQVGHVFYILEVRQYDNGHAHASMNFGNGSKVAISANSEREAIKSAVDAALAIKWDEPTEPSPSYG